MQEPLRAAAAVERSVIEVLQLLETWLRKMPDCLRQFEAHLLQQFAAQQKAIVHRLRILSPQQKVIVAVGFGVSALAIFVTPMLSTRGNPSATSPDTKAAACGVPPQIPGTCDDTIPRKSAQDGDPEAATATPAGRTFVSARGHANAANVANAADTATAPAMAPARPHAIRLPSAHGPRAKARMPASPTIASPREESADAPPSRSPTTAPSPKAPSPKAAAAKRPSPRSGVAKLPPALPTQSPTQSARVALRREALPPSPVPLLLAWLAEAEAELGLHARVMVVATSCAAEGPTARSVLLLGCDAASGQLTFGTSVGSLKARQLAAEPRVEAVLRWGDRQVRVRGVARLQREDAARDAYLSLPPGARLSLQVADQGKPIDEATHAAAVARVEAMAAAGASWVPTVPPPSYTAILIEPRSVEFYQGGRDVPTLGYIDIDRFLYVRAVSGQLSSAEDSVQQPQQSNTVGWTLQRLQA